MGRIIRKTHEAGSFRVRSADEGRVEAVVARTDQPDRDGDLFEPGSFAPTRVQVSSWGHSMVAENAAPVGVGRIEERGPLVNFVGRYFMDTRAGAEAFSIIKALGDDARWSFGFARADATTRSPTSAERTLGVRNVYTAVKALEVSPVLNPAQALTGTLAVKHQNDDDSPAFGLHALKLAMAEGGISHEDMASALEVDVPRLRRILRGEEPCPPLDTLKAVREPATPRRSPEETEAALKGHRARFASEFGPMVDRRGHGELRSKAAHVAAWTAARLGVPAPTVKVFEPGDAGPWGGCFLSHDPGSIWIRSDRGGVDLARAAIHETVHFAKHRRGEDHRDEAAVAAATEALLTTYALENDPRWHLQRMAFSAAPWTFSGLDGDALD